LRRLLSGLWRRVETLKPLYPFGKTRHSVLLTITQSADAFIGVAVRATR
jgi:hypothetical protein